MPGVSIRHQIRIRAPAERVWDTLVDFDRFPEWNPMLVRVNGRAEEGARFSFTVRLGNGVRLPLPAQFVRCDAPSELRWRAGVPGVLAGEHYIEVRPTGGGVVVAHGEEFRGVLCALLGGLLRSIGGPLYGRMNEALKARVEQAAAA